MFEAFQFAGRWLSFNDALKIALSCSRVLRGQSFSILLVILSIPGAPLGLQVDSVAVGLCIWACRCRLWVYVDCGRLSGYALHVGGKKIGYFWVFVDVDVVVSEIGLTVSLFLWVIEVIKDFPMFCD